MDEIKPDYYKFTVKGVEMDVMDVARAMKLPFTLSLALKYFRVKGDAEKRINDLQKAVEVINREIEYIKEENDLPF